MNIITVSKPIFSRFIFEWKQIFNYVETDYENRFELGFMNIGLKRYYPTMKEYEMNITNVFN